MLFGSSTSCYFFWAPKTRKRLQNSVFWARLIPPNIEISVHGIRKKTKETKTSANPLVHTYIYIKAGLKLKGREAQLEAKPKRKTDTPKIGGSI